MPAARSARRVVAVLVTLLAVTLGGTLTAAPAQAWGTDLCTGWTGCTAAGYSDAGYGAVSSISYWGMYPGHNCTNYAAYRLIQRGIDASYLRGQGMAYQWASVAASHGVLVDQTPTVGSIAWWPAGAAGTGSSGHVAYVEQILADGSIVTSEDNYGGDFHWRHWWVGGGYYPGGFIHFGTAAPTDTRWQLHRTATAGAADASFRYGGPAATVLGCDLNGDGRADIVAYVNGTWYVRFSPSAGPADLTFTYGGPGMTPVCGAWSGGARSGIGVFDGTTWWLRTTPSAGAPDLKFAYGWPGTVPVVGRWAGGAATGIGVWDPRTGSWWVRNTASPGNPDAVVQYGFPGATPVPADYDGNGRTDLAVFAGGRWYVRLSVTAGAPDRLFDYGVTGDRPVGADWDGDGVAGIAVTRPEA